MKNNLKKIAAIALTAVTAMATMNACNDEQVAAPGTPSNTVSVIKHIGPATGATECTVTSISNNATWAVGPVGNTNTFILHGDIRVKSGVTLTIGAGVLIKGEKASKGTLTIERGAKIIAIGTDLAPIVFTSDQPAGSRAPRDWGGIIILGNGISNSGVDQAPEGYPACVTKPLYGGTNNADNSGRLSFVRIEFAGVPVTSGDEKNSLTLYAVGSGTQIDHIQCSFGADDSFEWFGGAVNAKYLMSYRGGDDDFDTDFGYSGKVQYGIALRDPSLADNSESNGFESDNNKLGTAALPQTSAVFSNFTILGPHNPACGPVAPAAGTLFGDGLHLRRNTAIDVHNSIITGWPRNEVFIAAGVTGVALSFNTAVKPFDVVASLCVTEIGSTPWTTDVSNLCNDAAICGTSPTSSKTMSAKSGLNFAAWNLSNPNFSPLSNAVSLTNGTNAQLLDATFLKNSTTSALSSTTFFRGARRFVNDNGWKFTSGWVNYDPQNTAY